MIGNKAQILGYIADKKEDLVFKIDEIRESRSQAQNRLYWQWLRDLCGEFEKKGILIPKDDLHEGLRTRLIESTEKINALTGEQETVRKSTTKLNKKEFSKYLEDIERYLIEYHQISHPMPTDLFYND